MEEKERYKIDKSTNYYTNTIVDTKTNAYYGNVEEHIDLLNKQNKENQQLKQQLAITEKALKLACEEIGRIEAKFGSAYIRANGYLLDYFKTEAKEMLENE